MYICKIIYILCGEKTPKCIGCNCPNWFVSFYGFVNLVKSIHFGVLSEIRVQPRFLIVIDRFSRCRKEGVRKGALKIQPTLFCRWCGHTGQDTAHTCIHIYVLFNICSWRVCCRVQQVHHSELWTKWQQWHRLTNAPLCLALASFSSVSSTQLLFYCDQTYLCFESDHLGAVNINWTFCIPLWSCNTCGHLYCWTVLLFNTTGSCCER